VNALITAELLKLRTRTHAGLLFATLALVPLTVAVSIPEAGNPDAPVSLDDASLLAVAVGNGLGGVPLVLAILLGGVAFTQEFRYGTVTPTYLVEPRRHRVLVAKCVSLALASAVVTAVSLVVAVPVGIALIGSRDGTVSLGTQFWQMAAAGFVVTAVYAVGGVAIGALVRNQITVVIAVLVWMLAVERIVIQAYPSVGRWMPTATTSALLQLGPSVDPDGQLLSASASGVLLAAYALVAVSLALRLTPKRDVL
jgi:ABC-type transport system involved in multi-copper enzyme maturation permease subunit